MSADPSEGDVTVTPSLIVLGSGDALASQSHDHTALVVRAQGCFLLIDCPGSASLKLRRYGLDPADIDAVILTHGHADHIYGLPALLQYLDLTGRERPLAVYGNEDALARARAITSALDVGAGFASYRAISAGCSGEAGPFLDTERYAVRAFSARHSLPTIALRVVLKQSNALLAYSGDGEPCPEVIEAGRGVDLLVHEAAVLDPEPGHSTPAQAAEVAAAAGAARLLLVHLPQALILRPGAALAEAEKIFGGEVRLATDGDVIALRAR